MSIFGKITEAIFGSAAHAETMPAGSTAPSAKPASGTLPSPATPPAPSTTGSGAATPASNKMAAVDVAKVLDGVSDAQDEDLDWRKSIVDLMKLLKLDSGLKARKELAAELHYTGDMGDSASMNMWLHKQVMTKLAENGGIVPNDLKH